VEVFGWGPSTPPVEFAPVFMSNDEALIAAGVKPAHFREVGTVVGFRDIKKHGL